ncbi:MAG: ABC transporter permease [Myxococcales bacterium]|nr:ABC transporter permease [Myxococcales bacterium]
MTAVFTIARREIFAFFVSPMAYVVLTAWLLIFGVIFYLLALFLAGQGPGGGQSLIEAFYGGTTLFYLPLLVISPILTMRLMAEERSSGTIEALMTAPVTEVQIVLGKYLAALVYWVALWVPTLFYVWLAGGTGEDVIDEGAIAATYVGIFGIGLFYMAVGLLMSIVARNQIVAAVLTFTVLFGIFVIGLAGYATLDDDLRAVFEYLGLWTQMSSFSKGVVDTRYLVYDVSIAFLALFLSVRLLQAERWQS